VVRAELISMATTQPDGNWRTSRGRRHGAMPGAPPPALDIDRVNLQHPFGQIDTYGTTSRRHRLVICSTDFLQWL
jgi:hypothetical protein